jgi:hypothetical protein
MSGMNPCPVCNSEARVLIEDGWWRCLGQIFVEERQILVGMAQGRIPVFRRDPVFRSCGNRYIAHHPLLTIF